MKFKEFRTKLEAARAALKELTGDDNFPGLGKYDRVYELPADCYGWPAAAIVRAHDMSEHADVRIPITVWIWGRTGGHEAKPDEVTADMHAKLAEIQRAVTLWIRGELDELPPSTDRHWRLQ